MSNIHFSLIHIDQKFYLAFLCSHRINLNTEAHLRTLGLRHMPANMREINIKKYFIFPNRDSYVFIRVKGDAPSVLVSDGAGE